MLTPGPLLLVPLPAAATNSMSLLLALLISFKSDCEKQLDPEQPQLFESTRTLAEPVAPPNATLAWIVNSIALIAFAVVPEPVESKNLEPMILAVQFTPTTPRLLLPRAPMVPETCVPC